jgi:hypothetical protein
MPPVRFETTISAGERPKTYVLDRMATGTGSLLDITDCYLNSNMLMCILCVYICGAQSGIEAVFSCSASIFCPQYHSTNVP